MSNIMIIDTETANFVEQPLPYDIGYIILNEDTREVLVRRAYLIREIFKDRDLMDSAYYAEKIPDYWKKVKNKDRKILSEQYVRNIVNGDIKRYNVKRVGAYNMSFDKKSSNNTTRLITCSKRRWFFPYGIEFFCIWNMACSSILNTEKFINFAKANGFVSEKGNVKTSAEVAYRYITKNVNFEEAHTGVEDCDIETRIYFAVLDSKMDFDDSVKPNCWMTVQKLRRKMEKKGEV